MASTPGWPGLGSISLVNFAKPIALIQTLMGIGSLQPSHGWNRIAVQFAAIAPTRQNTP